MPDIIPTRQSRLRAAWLCIRSSRHYWHSALVTKLSVRQSPGFRARPGIRTFAKQLSAESVLRLLPSLKPLAWQSLSAPSLQSGAPLAETGHIIRPATIEEGVVRRDSVSVASLAASLAREFRSSIVCCELFRLGSLSNIFPISLSRPGFSSRAGDGAGSACGGPAGCVFCSWTPSAGGGAAPCGHAAPAAIISVNSAADGIATCFVDCAMRWPGRSSMMGSVPRSGQPASTSRPLSDHSERDHKSEHENKSEYRHPQPEAFLDLGTDHVTIAVEQDRDEKEPAATGDDRAQHEQPDIVAGKARGDGHELIGNRRQTFADDDPGAPFGIAGAERFDLVAKAIETDQPMPDRIIEHRADRVAEHAAGNRSNRAQGRKQPGPLGPRQRHRKQHDIRRHRKE